MFHCALQSCSLQRWCVWLSGRGCPPYFFWGRLCLAAGHSPPAGGRGRTTSNSFILSQDIPAAHTEALTQLYACVKRTDTMNCKYQHTLPSNVADSSRRTLAAYVANTAHALEFILYVYLMFCITTLQSPCARLAGFVEVTRQITSQCEHCS